MRKLYIITIFILIPILTVIIFQTYWVVETYNIKKGQFYININDALKSARKTGVIQESGFKNLLEDMQSHVQIFPDTLPCLNNEPLLSEGNLPIDVLLSKEGNHFIFSDSTSISNLNNLSIYDLITEVVSDLTGNDSDINIIDSLYKSELSKRGINIEYDIAFFQNDSLLVSTNRFVQNFQNPDIRMENLWLRESEKKEIRVVIQKKESFVLLNMWVTLITSFLLIAIVVIAFIYLLSFIFKQKKISDIKNDFINNMTHEFKTPIATVQAAIEAMNNFGVLKDKKKTSNYLSISTIELKKLSSMVEKVLRIASAEKENIELNKTEFSLSNLMEKTLNRLNLQHEEAILVNDTQEQINITADQMSIQNVLNNILDNAYKYCEATSHIYTKCTIKGNMVEIKVKDNGIGIPKEYHKVVFDKFYRVPGRTQYKVKGFGLGLSYVKNIIEKHLGTIQINSTETSSGSEFIILLPLR